MEIRQHASAREFLDRAGPWLLEAEAEDNLILGIASELVGDPRRYGPEDAYLATLEQDGRVCGAALRTPPRRLILTRAPAAAVVALAENLAVDGVRLPGVTGPVEQAGHFARAWAAATGATPRPGMSPRIYRCDCVVPPSGSPGCLRPAAASDNDLLVRWRRGFIDEIGLHGPDHATEVSRLLQRRQVYLWEDRQPVSAACWTGTAGRGARIGFVYTPPGERGKGYATSCVAALTYRLLNSGRRPCCLYADLANRTSNAIYQRIGYVPVCDWQEWSFE